MRAGRSSSPSTRSLSPNWLLGLPGRHTLRGSTFQVRPRHRPGAIAMTMGSFGPSGLRMTLARRIGTPGLLAGPPVILRRAAAGGPTKDPPAIARSGIQTPEPAQPPWEHLPGATPVRSGQPLGRGWKPLPLNRFAGPAHPPWEYLPGATATPARRLRDDIGILWPFGPQDDGGPENRRGQTAGRARCQATQPGGLPSGAHSIRAPICNYASLTPMSGTEPRRQWRRIVGEW